MAPLTALSGSPGKIVTGQPDQAQVNVAKSVAGVVAKPDYQATEKRPAVTGQGVSLDGAARNTATVGGLVDALKSAKPGERGPLLTALNDKVSTQSLTTEEKAALKQLGQDSIAWVDQRAESRLSRWTQAAFASVGELSHLSDPVAFDHLRLGGIVSRALGSEGPLGESSRAWQARFDGIDSTDTAGLRAALRELNTENQAVEKLLDDAREELEKQGGSTKEVEFWGVDAQRKTYASTRLPEFLVIEAEHAAQKDLFQDQALRCAKGSAFGPELQKLETEGAKLKSAKEALQELEAGAAKVEKLLAAVPKAEKKVEQAQEKVEKAEVRVDAAQDRLRTEQFIMPENQNGSWDRAERKIERREKKLEKREEILSSAEFNRQDAFASAYLAMGAYLRLVESKRAVLEGTRGALPAMANGEVSIEWDPERIDMKVGKSEYGPEYMPVVPENSPNAGAWLKSARAELEQARKQLSSELKLNGEVRQQTIDTAVGL